MLYGVTAGDQISAVFSNNGTELCSANVTTITEGGKVVAKFVLPVAGGTTLTNASVRFADKGSVLLTNTTISGKVYNVNKKLGGFSINANDDRVFFAPGNLQAIYNGSNWTWAFAEHQWDYIGNAAGNTSVTDTEPFINGTGTVDLFGWVGASSTWTGVNKFGITSSLAIVNTDGYGNVADEAMKAEWNSTNLDITNGGTYNWRTLTYDEWNHVLVNRTVTVNGASQSSYGHGSVNGFNGVIILPDGWDGSVDTGFIYGNSAWSNTYTIDSTPTWYQMEAAGCVFLPAAGIRNGASVSNAVVDGRYWSSTFHLSNTGLARSVYFFSNYLGTNDSHSRRDGHSVRLVRPVE